VVFLVGDLGKIHLQENLHDFGLSSRKTFMTLGVPAVDFQGCRIENQVLP